MKKTILIITGSISMSLGVAGIFLPLLPTTPLLLLAATCYLRSSSRLYHWLTSQPVLGTYIRSYLKFRAVAIPVKIFSIIMLWLVIGTSILFFMTQLWLRLLLLAVAAGVTIHLLTLKNLTREMLKELEAERKEHES